MWTAGPQIRVNKNGLDLGDRYEEFLDPEEHFLHSPPTRPTLYFQFQLKHFFTSTFVEYSNLRNLSR